MGCIAAGDVAAITKCEHFHWGLHSPFATIRGIAATISRCERTLKGRIVQKWGSVPILGLRFLFTIVLAIIFVTVQPIAPVSGPLHLIAICTHVTSARSALHADLYGCNTGSSYCGVIFEASCRVLNRIHTYDKRTSLAISWTEENRFGTHFLREKCSRISKPESQSHNFSQQQKKSNFIVGVTVASDLKVLHDDLHRSNVSKSYCVLWICKSAAVTFRDVTSVSLTPHGIHYTVEGLFLRSVSIIVNERLKLSLVCGKYISIYQLQFLENGISATVCLLNT